mmetsp:Transcript_10547/g.23237  ORF Transcript_10547/g.23237 Transcript_10547/m.23237 type:complete len:365 (-) Transcript_10547:246-1340(-)
MPASGILPVLLGGGDESFHHALIPPLLPGLAAEAADANFLGLPTNPKNSGGTPLAENIAAASAAYVPFTGSSRSMKRSHDFLSFYGENTQQMIIRSNAGDESIYRMGGYDGATDPSHCPGGRDYKVSCPEGWKTGWLNCMAPDSFYASGNCQSMIGKDRAFSKSIDQAAKKRVEKACGVKWPCAKVFAPDYRELCPQDWKHLPDGNCWAPSSYKGACAAHKSFLNYTEGMKQAWAESCDVAWPMVDASTLPSKRPGTNIVFRQDESTLPARERCKREYTLRCPDSYFLDANNVCQAPENWFSKEKQACAHVLTERWSEDMKKAFEQHCGVKWPCHWRNEVGPWFIGPSPVMGVDTPEYNPKFVR